MQMPKEFYQQVYQQSQNLISYPLHILPEQEYCPSKYV